MIDFDDDDDDDNNNNCPVLIVDAYETIKLLFICASYAHLLSVSNVIYYGT